MWVKLKELLICLVCMLVDSLIQHSSNPHSFFCTHTRTHSLVHISTRSDLHDPLLQYPPLLPWKVGRPKQMRRQKCGIDLANAKKRSRTPPTCSTCGMPGHKAINMSWHPKTWDHTNSNRHYRTHVCAYLCMVCTLTYAHGCIDTHIS